MWVSVSHLSFLWSRSQRRTLAHSLFDEAAFSLCAFHRCLCNSMVAIIFSCLQAQRVFSYVYLYCTLFFFTLQLFKCSSNGSSFKSLLHFFFFLHSFPQYSRCRLLSPALVPHEHTEGGNLEKLIDCWMRKRFALSLSPSLILFLSVHRERENKLIT